MASGGRFGYTDDGETPNTQLVAFEFDDCELQFEVRGLPTNDEAKVKIGDIFYGTEGVLAITSYTDWQTYMGPKVEPGPGGQRAAATTSPTSSRPSRAATPRSLNADIEEGHLSSAYCHLGNIAYRLGRKLHINPSTESFVNDAEADAMLTRDYRAPVRRTGQGLTKRKDARIVHLTARSRSDDARTGLFVEPGERDRPPVLALIGDCSGAVGRHREQVLDHGQPAGKRDVVPVEGLERMDLLVDLILTIGQRPERMA